MGLCNLSSIESIICRNDELSWTMSWVGCLLKDSDVLIIFAVNSQILSVIPILLTFMYLVALNLLVNSQLNSSLWHIIVTLVSYNRVMRVVFVINLEMCQNKHEMYQNNSFLSLGFWHVDVGTCPLQGPRKVWKSGGASY